MNLQESVTKIVFWILSTVLLIISSQAIAQDDSLRIRQALTNGSSIKAYIDARDLNNIPTDWVEITNVSAGENLVEVTDVVSLEESEEGVAYIFLIDVSKSTAKQFELIRKAFDVFVEKLKAHDKIAIVRFGSTVEVIHDFSGDKRSLREVMQSLESIDANTHLYDAIIKASSMGSSNRKDEGLPTMRAIVLLSDGENDVEDGAGSKRSEVESAVAASNIPLFAVWFPANKPTENQKKGGEFLYELAEERSGGKFYAATSAEKLPSLYASIFLEIYGAFVVEAKCETCVLDGEPQRVQFVVNGDGGKRETGIDLRFFPTEAIDPPTTEIESNKILPRDPDVVLDKIIEDSKTKPVTTVPEIVAVDPETLEPTSANLEVEPNWWKKQTERRLFWPTVGMLVALAAMSGALIWQWIVNRQPENFPANPRPRNRRSPVIRRKANKQKKPDAASRPGKKAGSAPVKKELKAQRLDLTVLAGRNDGPKYSCQLVDKILVGRAKHCDVAIEVDTRMGREHFAFQIEGDHIVLQDLGSSNGTFLNGVALSESRPIQDGDVVTAGGTRLRVNQFGGEA